jgi:Protein of Unknown function (DUF2784)
MESQAFYAASADAIVAIHTLFVGFVVIGQLLILIGLVCRWKWVRNPWFRVIHLLCIGIVATEAASGVICPLTVWERHLRDLAGQTVNDSAVGWFFNSILFFNMPREFFVWIHIGFGALVLGTFLFGPPRFRRLSSKPSTPRPIPNADNRKARLQPNYAQGSSVG